nr:vegetative cell wall protein gp1-like [Aegilops tauschii subsp. strangulata]
MNPSKPLLAPHRTCPPAAGRRLPPPRPIPARHVAAAGLLSLPRRRARSAHPRPAPGPDRARAPAPAPPFAGAGRCPAAPRSAALRLPLAAGVPALLRRPSPSPPPPARLLHRRLPPRPPLPPPHRQPRASPRAKAGVRLALLRLPVPRSDGIRRDPAQIRLLRRAPPPSPPFPASPAPANLVSLDPFLQLVAIMVCHSMY